MLLQMLRVSECKFADTGNEVESFLKQQYEYEIRRVPIHRAFEAQYRLSYFSLSAMLQYYINPLGDEKVQTAISECEYIYPVMMKRTLN